MDHQSNGDLEDSLEKLPDEIDQAMQAWDLAKLDREKTEALLDLKFRMERPDSPQGEIKALVQSNDERYAAVLKESQAKAEYHRLYETLMAKKLIARLWTAF